MPYQSMPPPPPLPARPRPPLHSRSPLVAHIPAPAFAINDVAVLASAAAASATTASIASSAALAAPLHCESVIPRVPVESARCRHLSHITGVEQAGALKNERIRILANSVGEVTQLFVCPVVNRNISEQCSRNIRKVAFFEEDSGKLFLKIPSRKVLKIKQFRILSQNDKQNIHGA